MKRSAAFVLAFLLLVASFAGAASKKSLTVNAVAVIKSNNHVGEDWIITHEFNGEEYFTDKKSDVTAAYTKKKEYRDASEVKSDEIHLSQGDTLIITTTIVEDEKKPDVSVVETEHVITASDLKNGFTEIVKVTVVEDAGRYKGCKAVWEITYEFIP